MCTTTRVCAGPTFGASLRILSERSGVEVPIILGDILRWLAANAIAQPDVFAQPPKCAVTSQLKLAIDLGAPLVDLVEDAHPAVVGSLLKRWLEELPNPLLNWDQQVDLLSACKDEGCIESRIEALNNAVALVDHITLGTLKPLLLFLQQYCFRQRRFDQQLLQVAVAFAPILFPAALAAGLEELRLAEETVATLVSNALHVFNPLLAANVPVVTPQALCEAAAEMMVSEQQHSCGHRAPSLQPIEVSADEDFSEQAYCPQEEPYEPYVTDPAFMLSLHGMVDNCVGGALFAFDECSEEENAWSADDDCGSVASSSSNTQLSSGGASGSSGGASSCSTTSSNGMQPQPEHTAAQPQSLPSYGRCNPSHDVGDVPYSPHVMRVEGLRTRQEHEPVTIRVNVAPDAITKTAGVKGSGAVPASVSLAELAHREVADGSVFCIISAQPGAASLAVAASDAVGKTARSKSLVSKASQGVISISPQPTIQLQQQSPLVALDVAGVQAGSVDPYAPSRYAGSRRSTEGGAAAKGPVAVPTQGQMPSRPAASGSPSAHEPRQRRMTMGGGDMQAGAAEQQPQLQPQTRSQSRQQQLASSQPQSSPPANPGSTNPGASQHQRSSRRAASGSSNSGGAASTAGGSARPQQPGSLLPLSVAHGNGCVADLGVAGHLHVALTATHTLSVRELLTPEAAAHVTPIRSMSTPAMQMEKERLKRQLKDVAAAYESLAGRPLTPTLKEPLRPVYVRYHKIKALLNKGAGDGVSCKDNQEAAAGAVLQKHVVLTSSRPAVVV